MAAVVTATTAMAHMMLRDAGIIWRGYGEAVPSLEKGVTAVNNAVFHLAIASYDDERVVRDGRRRRRGMITVRPLPALRPPPPHTFRRPSATGSPFVLALAPWWRDDTLHSSHCHSICPVQGVGRGCAASHARGAEPRTAPIAGQWLCVPCVLHRAGGRDCAHTALPQPGVCTWGAPVDRDAQHPTSTLPAGCSLLTFGVDETARTQHWHRLDSADCTCKF